MKHKDIEIRPAPMMCLYTEVQIGQEIIMRNQQKLMQKLEEIEGQLQDLDAALEYL